ncbi:YdcF family protein [Dechloromonas sp. A34]|uniref:YdcF family protein n=1 Tax=Dechloromonas sp. A34 TaxID=447588 RepID=UPI0022489205|nr:YdcF family protein [Dechloromonas sp. A34]
MSTALFLKSLLGNLLLPPTNGLLFLALAAICRRRRWAFAVAIIGGGLLLAQSLPPVAGLLIAPLEQRAGPAMTDPQGARAIVVLGSGLNLDAEEYGGDTVTDRSLIRLRYGATLAERHHLPVLVTGGRPFNASRSEAEVIGDILEREFKVAVRWRETESEDTADNAAFSAKILRDAGIRRVVLVTQAFHMPRAQRLFEAAGLEVVPAPTELAKRREQPWRVLDWLPQARALQTSYYALHEWLGLAWLELQRLAKSAN